MWCFFYNPAFILFFLYLMGWCLCGRLLQVIFFHLFSVVRWFYLHVAEGWFNIRMCNNEKTVFIWVLMFIKTCSRALAVSVSVSVSVPEALCSVYWASQVGGWRMAGGGWRVAAGCWVLDSVRWCLITQLLPGCRAAGRSSVWSLPLLCFPTVLSPQRQRKCAMLNYPTTHTHTPRLTNLPQIWREKPVQ